MKSIKFEIDPKELCIEVDLNKTGATQKIGNKFGLDKVKITHTPTGIVTECNLGCRRHPDISAWNINRRKCAISQLKQKINDKISVSKSQE